MSASLFKSFALLLVVASSCLAQEFTGDNDDPLLDPFTGKKTELFRTSREAKGTSELVQSELQQLSENVESGQLNQNQFDGRQQQQQLQQTADVMPVFSGGKGAAQVQGDVITQSQVAELDGGQQQQQQQQQSSSSSSSSAAKKSASSKTITTTTTTTTTTHNNQDQPQVAQIKEIRVHTVPLSEAVHYANYMVVPISSRAANLEESSSSSSSQTSSSSSRQEVEQVAVAQAPTVVVNPPPVTVAPDCVLHRLIVERPVSSQLVVNVAPEVVTSHSSSSRSSRVVSQTAAVAPETTVYTIKRVFTPPVVQAARVVAVPASVPASREESSHFESRSSRHESSGVGHSVSSSSSSSSSSHTSKSTTSSQTSAALVAPPPPSVRTVTTLVSPAARLVAVKAAPVVAVKAAPLVEVSSGRTNDVSVDVDHRQSGPNYNYGYSIKQRSSEPSTKGVVIGDRVVYLR